MSSDWRNASRKQGGVGNSAAHSQSGMKMSYVLAHGLADALNPDKVPPKPSAVKSFKDMSETERAAMRALYERKP